jgi:hypothetical protein
MAAAAVINMGDNYLLIAGTEAVDPLYRRGENFTKQARGSPNLHSGSPSLISRPDLQTGSPGRNSRPNLHAELSAVLSAKAAREAGRRRPFGVRKRNGVPRNNPNPTEWFPLAVLLDLGLKVSYIKYRTESVVYRAASGGNPTSCHHRKFKARPKTQKTGPHEKLLAEIARTCQPQP